MDQTLIIQWSKLINILAKNENRKTFYKISTVVIGWFTKRKKQKGFESIAWEYLYTISTKYYKVYVGLKFLISISFYAEKREEYLDISKQRLKKYFEMADGSFLWLSFYVTLKCFIGPSCT